MLAEETEMTYNDQMRISRLLPSYRQWDETWTASDGKVLPLQRIAIKLNFPSPFMFDISAEETTTGKPRRIIASDAPGSIEDTGRLSQILESCYQNAQTDGFDGCPPKSCAKLLLITATRPNRKSGETETVYAEVCSPYTLTMANMVLMVPAMSVTGITPQD